MFLDEITSKPTSCPHCKLPLGNDRCSHLVLDVDTENWETVGPWSEHFDNWVNRLKRAIVDQARTVVKHQGHLRDAVRDLQKQYRGREMPNDYDDVDVDGLWGLTLSVLGDVDGLASVSGAVDSGPWSSSSGTFLFALDPQQALESVQLQIDALCASHEVLTKRSPSKRRQ